MELSLNNNKIVELENMIFVDGVAVKKMEKYLIY